MFFGSCGGLQTLHSGTEEVASLHMAEGLELEDLQEPFQPKPFYDSMASVLYQMPNVCSIECLDPVVATAAAIWPADFAINVGNWDSVIAR